MAKCGVKIVGFFDWHQAGEEYQDMSRPVNSQLSIAKRLWVLRLFLEMC